MYNFIDIFNPTTTVLPFSPDQLDSIVKSTVSSGFVMCNYNELITTINKINTAKEYDITLNAESILQNSTDPTQNNNVIIQVEGDRVNNIYNAHLISADDNNLCSFDTYSVEFKTDVYNLKRAMLKKYICNYESLNAWASAEGVSITEDTILKLCNDFQLFVDNILLSKDLESFVRNLSKESIDTYVNALIKYGKALLQKYKVEVLTHFKNIAKLETVIKIKNPIIIKIYALSAVATKCKHDWPNLQITPVDRKSFESLSLYL